MDILGRIMLQTIAINANIVVQLSSTSRSKCLNGKHLSLLHLSLILVLDKRDRLSTVDLVMFDVMRRDVADWFDGVCLSVDFDFVAFHRFLDCSTDVANTNIDSRSLDTAVGSVFDGSQEIIIRRIKRHCKRTVYNPSVDLHAEINLHDILILENNVLLAWVRRVVRSLVIQTKTRRKAHSGLDVVAGFNSLVSQKRTDTVLNAIGNLIEGVAGLDILLSPLSDLTMYFCRFAIVVQKRRVLKLFSTLVANFLSCSASRVKVIRVALNLTNGVVLVCKELAQGNPGR